MDVERVQPARDLFGMSHTLEDQAASFVCVTSAALGNYGPRLAEGLCNQQQVKKHGSEYEASHNLCERIHIAKQSFTLRAGGCE